MSVHLIIEIDKLKKRIANISLTVEAAIQKAVRALIERDATLAQEVIDGDELIDQGEVETEEECLKILALYQPVAIDLRLVIAILKINNDLERMADQAVNIADRVKYLASAKKLEIPVELTVMADKVQAMLKLSLKSLVDMDAKLARQTIQDDDEVDNLNRLMYSLIQDRLKNRREGIPELISVLSVSRQLERIADAITNIAEDVIYMAEGTIIRHSPNRIGSTK